MKLGVIACTFVVLFPTGLFAAGPSDMKVGNLRCEYLADPLGIDTVGPAFKRIVIRPQVGEGLEWAQGTYESVRGPISVDWEKTGESLSMAILIPPNSTATVYVPAAGKSAVKESGKPIDDSARV